MIGVSGRTRDEHGVVAVLVAILFPVVFIACAAIAVDSGRWYVEGERIQKAADAAALAGVTYLPQDLDSGKAMALLVAKRNGYDDASSGIVVTADKTSKASELQVTISSRVANSFGGALGVKTTTISRSATADYTGPAPMGSPCNTFGNEPPSQASPAAQPAGSALPAVPVNPFCTTQPYFWAAIEGPATDKVQGDRYSTTDCGSSNVSGGGVFGLDPDDVADKDCEASANPEYYEPGYFFVIKVQKAAINKPINMQLYDPAFVRTGVTCGDIVDQADLSTTQKWKDLMNPYVTTDGVARYDDVTSKYCSGDYFPGGGSTTPAVTTSFAVREQTDTGDPVKGAVVSGCTKQYRGQSTTPTSSSLRQKLLDSSGNQTTNSNSSYNDGLAKVFHSWTDLCTFTPTREGDYYLQVRTNVSLPGSGGEANVNGFNPVTYAGNAAATALTGNSTTGLGLNSFAMRAVPSNAADKANVSVAGYSRMPILQNSPSSKATFNLIRALPGAAGQYISFDFFDAGDGASSGSPATVQVLRPTDATGSIATTTYISGCKGTKNQGTLAAISNCAVSINNTTHDGQLQTISIPVPPDYSCNSTAVGGCWFRVEINFPGSVTDFTTWDATVTGEPVRITE